MEHSKAVAILSALSNGTDPFTGESFAADSPYQHPEVVRALFHALHALEERNGPADASSAPVRPKEKPARPNVANAGKPWSKEEEARLAAAFDVGTPIEDLAVAHGRSRLAVETRLAMLGRLPMPERTRYPLRGRTEGPAAGEPAAPRYAVPA